MSGKAKYTCLYCESLLEECVGAMGICPVCREVWMEGDYLEVLNNKCPECGAYPRKDEWEHDFQCPKCDHLFDKQGTTPEEPLPLPVTLDMDALLIKIEEEMIRADKKHGPMEDPEEGWYTTQCEFFEWKKEVFKRNKNPEDAEKECIQLIAMGIKWLRDCLPQMIEEKKEKDNGNN